MRLVREHRKVRQARDGLESAVRHLGPVAQDFKAAFGLGLISGLAQRRGLRTVNVVPRQTAETLKEDVQWLKTQTRSDAR